MDIIEIFEKFPKQEDCIKHLEEIRWNNKPNCPYCKSYRVTSAPKELRHHCNNCKTTFSVTVGTIFHNTKLPLQKWFLATSLILNAKKGMSARQLSRHLKVNKDTAWRIGMKIRQAMCERFQRELLSGLVEADETYVGGKPRKGTEGTNKKGRGTKKTPVLGLIERNGRVKAQVIKKTDLQIVELTKLVRGHVDEGKTTLITDEFSGYLRIKNYMTHNTINHRTCYVDGEIHTNNIESFWAILKRGIIGQFHKVSLYHLPKYIDEFCYRHNNRKNPDVFDLTLQRAVGIF